MIGLGTLINTAAVIAGGLAGMMAKKGLKERYQKILMNACGLSVLFIGAAGTFSAMLKVLMPDGTITTRGSMLLVASLVLGGLAGEAIDIERRMDSLGALLKRLFHSEHDNLFIEGFVNTSLVICVGAMAIVGSIQDGLTGNYSTLTVKAVLDFIIVMVFAASHGPGTICAAIPIFLYQGAITVAAHFAGNFVSETMITNVSYIGSALIFCVGINLAFGKRFKVGNLLPSLLVPIAYDLILKATGLFPS